MEDIKKSINSILQERLASPFFGTLIISWLLWNWKIIYITFFVSQDIIKINKIDFIIANYSDYHFLITYPIVSTIILLTIVPFISNGAYWLSLIFNKWKNDQKNSLEKKQLLTLEQSIELRELLSAQETRFEKLLESKNFEIKQLKAIIDNRTEDSNKLNSINIIEKSNNQNEYDEELNELYRRFRNNSIESENYDKVVEYIQSGFKMTATENPPTSIKFITLLESHNIIQNMGSGKFQFTERGKKFNKLMSGYSGGNSKYIQERWES